MRRLPVARRGPRSGPDGERGSAVVEFVFLGVLFLVPLVYLVLVVGRLQAASYATTGAAREAGRAFVTTPAPPGTDATQAARLRAEAAARLAFGDHHFDTGTITLTCSAQPCLTPDARVEVTATVVVDLPLIPSVVADVVPIRIPVSSTQTVTVDRFRAS